MSTAVEELKLLLLTLDDNQFFDIFYLVMDEFKSRFPQAYANISENAKATPLGISLLEMEFYKNAGERTQ